MNETESVDRIERRLDEAMEEAKKGDAESKKKGESVIYMPHLLLDQKDPDFPMACAWLQAKLKDGSIQPMRTDRQAATRKKKVGRPVYVTLSAYRARNAVVRAEYDDKAIHSILVY